MGWTVYYQVHRDRILDEREREKIGEILADIDAREMSGEPFRLQYATEPREDRAIAWGSTKLDLDEGEFDLEHVLDGLSALRALLPDAEFFASGDYDTVRWDVRRGRYSSTSGDPDPEPDAMVVWVDGAPWIEPKERRRPSVPPSSFETSSFWEPPEEFFSAPAPRTSAPIPFPADLPKAEPVRDGWTAEDEQHLTEIAMGRDVDRHRAALAERDPRAVVLAGLAKRGFVGRYAFASTVEDALARLKDAGQLASIEAAVCDALADGVPEDDWDGFAQMLPPAAELPRVVETSARLLLGEHGRMQRCALANLLGKSCAKPAFAALAARARRDRGRPESEAPWRRNVVGALIDGAGELALPTVLLELNDKSLFVVEHVVGRLHWLGDKGRELLDQVLACGVYADRAMMAALSLRRDDPAWWLGQLRHPSYHVRIDATRWLLERGHPSARAATAAVWSAIDALELEPWDCIYRQDAAEALGIPLERTIDWRHVVAERGLAWMELPPLPTVVEMLCHPDPHLRERARNLLGARQDMKYALALSLVQEVETVLVGSDRTFDPLYYWDLAFPYYDGAFSAMWRDAAARAAWLREYADRIAPQELPSALADVLERGAVAAAARFQPGIPIDPDVLARADADEQALAALADELV